MSTKCAERAVLCMTPLVLWMSERTLEIFSTSRCMECGSPELLHTLHHDHESLIYVMKLLFYFILFSQVRSILFNDFHSTSTLFCQLWSAKTAFYSSASCFSLVEAANRLPNLVRASTITYSDPNSCLRSFYAAMPYCAVPNQHKRIQCRIRHTVSCLSVRRQLTNFRPSIIYFPNIFILPTAQYTMGVFNSSPDHWDGLMLDRSAVGELSSLSSTVVQNGSDCRQAIHYVVSNIKPSQWSGLFDRWAVEHAP